MVRREKKDNVNREGRMTRTQRRTRRKVHYRRGALDCVSMSPLHSTHLPEVGPLLAIVAEAVGRRAVAAVDDARRARRLAPGAVR